MTEDAIERIEQTLRALDLRLRAIEDQMMVRGVPADREVVVGGQRVRLRPLPPAEWVRALGELPGFLFLYLARPEQPSDQAIEEQLGALVDHARRLLAASMDPQHHELLQDLSVPEARAALGVIVRLNGLDEELARFFREQVQHLVAGPDGQEVRGAPEPAPARN